MKGRTGDKLESARTYGRIDQRKTVKKKTNVLLEKEPEDGRTDGRRLDPIPFRQTRCLKCVAADVWSADGSLSAPW